MATFLKLCQDVARESGTVSGTGQPASVMGNTGRLEKIVNWTADAWVAIQNSKTAWRFRRKEFSGALLVNTAQYTAASFDVLDLSEWLQEQELLTVYKTSMGVSDESPLLLLDWADYRRFYKRGQQDAGRPSVYAISPQGELCIGPKPDAAYTIQGEYVRTAQFLTANADVPIIPADYHDIIVWKALIMLADHDEAAFQRNINAEPKFREYYSNLCRSQLPRVQIGNVSLA